MPRQIEPFFAGPVPLGWLQKAGHLSGRAFVVGIVVWHLQKLTKAKEIRFSFKMAKAFGLDRWAVYRGLEALEKSGLIRVNRRKGCSPRVTLLSNSAVLNTCSPPSIPRRLYEVTS